MLEEVIVESESGHPASRIILFRVKTASGITNKCDGDITHKTSLKIIFLKMLLTLEGEIQSFNCILKKEEFLRILPA